jgi:hypothetical protein
VNSLRETDNYYNRQAEPIRSCLLALHKFILSTNNDISEAWKYGMPFFCYRKKMFCYLWIDKKINQPYIGFVEGRKMEHPQLIAGNRARMKIMIIDPNKDLPVKTIKKIVQTALVFYEK